MHPNRKRSLDNRMGSAESQDQIFAKARTLQQSGKIAEAIRLYEKVLRQTPEHAIALNYLGIANYQLGNLLQAVPLLQKALALKPDIAGTHYNLATTLHKLCRYEEAVHHYKKAIAIKPDDFEAYNNLAVVLKILARYDEAIECYQKAVALNPGYAEAYTNLANALQMLARHEEAIAYYKQALALNPSLIEAHMNFAHLLQVMDRNEQVIELYQKVLALKPDYAEAHLGLGNALQALCRRDEAVQHYEQALVLKPGYAEAYLSLGNTLQALNRHDDATRCYEKALALSPQRAEAHVLLGNMLSMLDRYDEAIQCYEKALELKPHFSAAKWHKGLLYLSMGRFAEGWELYESRWAGVFNERAKRRYLQPRWDGDNVKGSLLIWGEGGLGDYVLFSSMVPELTGRANSVVLEVEPRLVKLFARSFPQVRVFAMNDELYDGPVDAHESLAGLGKFLRPSWESFPRRRGGYLFPDDELATQLRRRLTVDRRFLVGLSWVSAKPWLHEPISAPLRDFGALLRLLDCRFVDLQYGDTLTEREIVARESGVLVERLADVDNTNDLDALAALISACDLVVTISNTTAHLAGALGKPTWVLVPYDKSRTWHWFKGKDESPWYPRVRVIRQQRGQPWADLIFSVTKEISTFIRETLHAS
jgi:tetratricopeptide (TPR) repeat protein